MSMCLSGAVCQASATSSLLATTLLLLLATWWAAWVAKNYWKQVTGRLWLLQGVMAFMAGDSEATIVTFSVVSAAVGVLMQPLGRHVGISMDKAAYKMCAHPLACAALRCAVLCLVLSSVFESRAGVTSAGVASRVLCTAQSWFTLLCCPVCWPVVVHRCYVSCLSSVGRGGQTRQHLGRFQLGAAAGELHLCQVLLVLIALCFMSV